jgi:hypothetical protein
MAYYPGNSRISKDSLPEQFCSCNVEIFLLFPNFPCPVVQMISKHADSESDIKQKAGAPFGTPALF